MWMPRECQCNQDKLVNELRELLDSTHPAWMETTYTFPLLSCAAGGPSAPACPCSAPCCQQRRAPTSPPPTAPGSAPWTKTSASWLQLGAFIAAAQQPRQRDAVRIYPTHYTFLLARREHRKLSSLYLLPLPKDIKCGSSKQIGHRKPLRKAEYDNEGITLNQPGPDSWQKPCSAPICLLIFT